MSIQNIKEVPKNIILERALLNSVFDNNEHLDAMMDILSPLDFYDAKNKKLYETMRVLYSEGKDIDFLGIVGIDQDLGNYCSDLQIECDHIFSKNIPATIETIRKNSLSRKIIEESRKIEAMGYECEVGNAYERLLSVASSIEGVEIDTDFNGELELLYERIKSGKKEEKIPTGIKVIDELIMGFTPGQLVCVAGRPGQGKSVLMMCMMKNTTETSCLISLEMSKREIATRLLANYSFVEAWKIEQGKEKMDNDDKKQIAKSFEEIKKEGFNIFDKPMGIAEIKMNISKMVRQKKVRLVFIDYLQIISEKGRKENRSTFIGQITRELKALAMKLGIVIIFGSQLNRGIEGRQIKEPMLSDLRESGDIENDCDIVIAIQKEDPEHQSLNEIVNLYIMKNRNGKTGRKQTTFNGGIFRLD